MAKKNDKSEQAYKVYKVPIESVKLNPSNPRVIQDSKFLQLVNSVKEDGFMLSIRFLVVDKEGIVLGGNQRLKACQAAGLSHVYIVKAEDLTDEQKKEFIIKDNTYFGEWDTSMLSTIYSDKEMADLGMNLVEVSQPRLENIGDIVPEIDESDLQKRKDVYENNKIKQVMTYFPLEIYEKVIESMDEIKKHMKLDENREMLLNLISFWKHNYESNSNL